MEIDDIMATTDFAEETRRVNRRQLIQQAITLAMQSRWQEAADANRQIVEMTPDDAEAYNRLGKAYTELGRIADARDAYESAMRADPANLIAQRNLDRLSHISDAEAAEITKRAAQKLDPRFFMEETGKTRVTTLQAVACHDIGRYPDR
jgi:Flp pilus assembly protein TadD